MVHAQAAADPLLCDVHSRSAIDLALDAKFSGVVAILQPDGAAHDMLDAATTALLETIRLCKLTMAPDSTRRLGSSLLARSIRDGQEHAKRDVNVPAENGVSLLMAACYGGDIALVRRVIGWGAAINHRSDRGSTALIMAAQQGHFAVVSELLTTPGMKVDSSSISPLTIAATLGHDAILVSLLTARTEDWPSKANLSEALLCASENGHIACITSLLSVGHAPVNSAGVDAMTPLMKVGSHGHPVCASILLQAGASLAAVDNAGRNAVMQACAAGHVSAALALINGIQKSRKRASMRMPSAAGGDRSSDWADAEERHTVESAFLDRRDNASFTCQGYLLRPTYPLTHLLGGVLTRRVSTY